MIHGKCKCFCMCTCLYLSLHFSMADVINNLKSQIKDSDREMRVHRNQVMEDALKHNITPTKKIWWYSLTSLRAHSLVAYSLVRCIENYIHG